MRKHGRTIVFALLLLLVPVLANAWTLTVRVNGSSSAGKVTVTYTDTLGNANVSKEILAGTEYVQVKNGTNAVATVTTGTNMAADVYVDYAKQADAGSYTIEYNNANHNLTVNFATAANKLGNVKVNKIAGGTVLLQYNGTSSMTEFTNLVFDTKIGVKVSPRTDYKVTSITVADGAQGSTTYKSDLPFTDPLYFAAPEAGQSVTVSLPVTAANMTVTAAYSPVYYAKPMLSAPLKAVAGKSVTVNATGTTSNTNITYAFEVKNSSDVVVFSRGASANPAFTFIPTVAGELEVTLTIPETSATKTATINVVSEGTAYNNLCTGCHTGSTPAIIEAYTAGTHGNPSVSCVSCHTQSPHAAAPGEGDIYVGSAVCASCHAEEFASHAKSGHVFKVNKVVDNTMPTFPFSSVAGKLQLVADNDTDATNGNLTDNTAGDPRADWSTATYADVTYVIGGYGWKARWMDKDGYLITGTHTQYNLPQAEFGFAGGMGAYNNNSLTTFNCGNCHTTGWRPVDSAVGQSAKQDDMPGILGTFVAAGVQCESCHGAGKAHALAPAKSNIVKVATPRSQAQLSATDQGFGLAVACSECHCRDAERNSRTAVRYQSPFETAMKALGASANFSFEGGRIIQSGGLAQHHEQIEELQGIDPTNPLVKNGEIYTDTVITLGKKYNAGMTCGVCHSPHKTVKHANHPDNTDTPGVDVGCTDCHTVSFNLAGSHATTDCKTCHMPYLVKSAINTTTPGTGVTAGQNKAGVPRGDIKTHIFKIDLSKTVQNSGGYQNPWITPNYACGECHRATGSFSVATKLGVLNTNYGGKVHGAVAYNHTDVAKSVDPAKGDSCLDCHTAVTGAAPTPVEGDYVGSAQCGVCHTDKYATFIQSGHPYKLSKVVDNTMPAFPFTPAATLQDKHKLLADNGGEGDANGNLTDNIGGDPRASWADATYEDFSYMVGGYGWKARWIDNKGFVISGSATQYNLPKDGFTAGGMVAYNNNKITKYDYNCNYCHVTGAKVGSIIDSEKPGFDGDTFAMPGIQCEACHGAGLDHITTGSKTAITRVATPRTRAQLQLDQGYGKAVACGECHTRDNERLAKYDFKSYFEKYQDPADLVNIDTTMTGLIISNSHGRTSHHEVNEELQGIDPTNIAAGPQGAHRNLKCSTCHDPHQPLVYAESKTDALKKVCTDCHSGKTYAADVATMMANAGAPNCVDCHMPHLVQNAVSVSKNGWTFGDNRSHSLKIDLSKSAKVPGQQNILKTDADNTARWYAFPIITREFACQSCHTDADVNGFGALDVHP